MGFFSSILGGAARLAGRFFGVGAAPAATRAVTPFIARPGAAALGRTPSLAGRVVRGVGAAAVAGGAFAAGDVALSALLDGPGDGAVVGGAAVGAGCPGGATGNIVTTLVVTRNAMGDIICTRRLRGSPHLMNSDLIVAKRVRRVASSLAQKLVPKTRKQSKAARLTEAVQDAVMRRVTQDAACPTGSAHA